MEFIIISDSKIKIMLAAEEMKKYGLDDKRVNYANQRHRRIFWQILDKAAEITGFSFKGEKLLIQFYPSDKGGEIFVTKLGAISKNAEKTLAESDKVTMLSSETKIFRFTSLGALRLAVHKLPVIPSEARCYRSERGEYFIVFEERAEMSPSGLLPSDVMREYSSEVPKNLEYYIREHLGEENNALGRE